MIDEEARSFIAAWTERARPLSKRAALAQWRLSVDASEAAERETAHAQVALAELYADAAIFEEAKRLDAALVADPLLRREVRLLHLATLTYRRDPETLRRIAQLEAELEGQFSTYRGDVHGHAVSDNDIRTVLVERQDSDERRLAWEAQKGIGPLVAPKVLELVRLRNGVARSLGHRDWFAFALATDELDERRLFATLDQLESATEEPFATEKAAIDAEASAALKVPVGELMPWHYQDVFFQEAPTTERTSLDPLVRDRDVVSVARAFYDELGFGADVESILSRSDLWPRQHTTQHAFCSDIDREGDVRVVCNVTASERWLETTLHELGHGVYDLGIDRALPWGLRAPAHLLTTEAIAMMMGRRTRDPEFLRRYLAPRDAEHQAADRELLRRRMLLLSRWVPVMTRFEAELYREPTRDAATLGRIWWDLVERCQRLRRPPGDRPTDWATKIHVALAPVYYQNYLLGELTASQIEHAMLRDTGARLTGNRAAGDWLRARWFRPGASLRWDALVERATGAPLSPQWFAADFVAG